MSSLLLPPESIEEILPAKQVLLHTFTISDGMMIALFLILLLLCWADLRFRHDQPITNGRRALSTPIASKIQSKFSSPAGLNGESNSDKEKHEASTRKQVENGHLAPSQSVSITSKPTSGNSRKEEGRIDEVYLQFFSM